MYGDMHGIIGASLPQIKMLEPSEGGGEAGRKCGIASGTASIPLSSKIPTIRVVPWRKEERILG